MDHQQRFELIQLVLITLNSIKLSNFRNFLRVEKGEGEQRNVCNKKSGASKVGVGGGHEEEEQLHGEKRKGRGKNRRWEQGKGEKKKVRGSKDYRE